MTTNRNKAKLHFKLAEIISGQPSRLTHSDYKHLLGLVAQDTSSEDQPEYDLSVKGLPEVSP